MISPKYLIYHDLIGFLVYAKPKSKKDNNKFVNIGTVIDDKQNVLITEKNTKIKTYIKKNYIFRFKIAEGMIEVNGLKIVGIPENRLRSLKKKKWLRK
jgi:RNase P/RNase MRP subunit p29